MLNNYRVLIGSDCTFRVEVNPKLAAVMEGFHDACGAEYFGYRENGGKVIEEKGKVVFQGDLKKYNGFFNSRRNYIVFSVSGEKSGNQIMTNKKPKICLFTTKEEKEFLRRLKTPVIFNDPELGEFWAEYGRDKLGKTITHGGINFDVDLESKECLEDFKKMYHELDVWIKAARDFAIADMLPLAHDWQDEEEEPIREEDFGRRIRLAGIDINKKGFRFYYYDDDIFLGHVIELEGNLKEGFISSDIIG